MAFIEFPEGIASVSGTLQKFKDGTRLVAMTRKAPTASSKPKTRVYLRNYERKTQFTEKEYAAHALFARRQALVTALIKEGRCKSKKEAWNIAREKIKNSPDEAK